MTFLGHKVILTTLDPIPKALQAGKGVVVMTPAELRALRENDGETFKRIVARIYGPATLKDQPLHG